MLTVQPVIVLPWNSNLRDRDRCILEIPAPSAAEKFKLVLQAEKDIAILPLEKSFSNILSVQISPEFQKQYWPTAFENQTYTTVKGCISWGVSSYSPITLVFRKAPSLEQIKDFLSYQDRARVQTSEGNLHTLQFFVTAEEFLENLETDGPPDFLVSRFDPLGTRSLLSLLPDSQGFVTVVQTGSRGTEYLCRFIGETRASKALYEAACSEPVLIAELMKSDFGCEIPRLLDVIGKNHSKAVVKLLNHLVPYQTKDYWTLLFLLFGPIENMYFRLNSVTEKDQIAGWFRGYNKEKSEAKFSIRIDRKKVCFVLYVRTDKVRKYEIRNTCCGIVSDIGMYQNLGELVKSLDFTLFRY